MTPLIYKILGGLVILIGIWFAGDYHGHGVVNDKWNKQKLVDAQYVAMEHVRQLREKQAYDAQIAEAHTALGAAQRELTRIAAIPHPHLVCHTAPASGGVPQVPNSSGIDTARAGKLPDGIEFDPTSELYAEARRADTLVEACRDFYNRWPKG